MDRVDLLATDPGNRYRALTGHVLDSEPDEALQAIVEQAARELMCPMAAVTLVLEHTQMFRAHVGIPASLAAGIDRDVGFCQWVVQEGRVVTVEELAGHALMPQRAVIDCGLRAYVGAPVVLEGFIVGALCVLDNKPRSFGSIDEAALAALAESASDRLADLARPSHARIPRSRFSSSTSSTSSTYSTSGTSGGGRSVVDELRRGMVPLRSDVARARVLAADADAPFRAARSGALPHPLLTKAADAAAELGAVLKDIDTTSAQLDDDSSLLEIVLSEDELAQAGAMLSEVVAFADGLARRITRERGGVRWPPMEKPVAVRASRTVAAGILAATLGEVAMRQDNDDGTDAYIRVEPSSVSIHLDASLDRDRAAACAIAIGELLGSHPSARVESAGPLVVVRLLRAYDC